MSKKMMLIGFLVILFTFALSYAQGDNSPDPNVNLACDGSAIITGSVAEGEGRGVPTDIVYDPSTMNYLSNVSGFHEYGFNYDSAVGGITKENPFYWQVEWPTAKNINYITALSCAFFGNQPQPHTGWAIQVWADSLGKFVDLPKAHNGWRDDSLRGAGGWINGDLFEWRGIEPVVTTKVRLCAFPNPDSLADADTTFADSLWSFTFIGNQDNGVRTTLIQYIDFTDMEADNEMDPMVNLGLIPEAVVSAKFKAGELDNIRGTPTDLLFDPVKGDFHFTGTPWGEFGYPWDYTVGYLTYEDCFYWMVEWPVPKNINFFTWGGVYGNQPQPTTPWAVEYWDGTEWVEVLSGVGGSFEEGDTLYPYTPGVDTDALSIWMSETPIQTTKFRLAVWSDGIDPLWSYHIRGRGGTTLNWDERDESFKAILLQYKDLNASAIGSNEVKTATKFSLSQNYPNPFNPTTNIAYSLEHQGHVRLSVYNVLGQEVAVLVNEVKDAGYQNITFDASSLSSGLYFYKLQVDDKTLTKKMLLMR